MVVKKQLTIASVNLGINLHPGVFRDHVIRNWHAFVNWDSLFHNRVILHATKGLESD